MKRFLFVCSQNKLRSPTAEQVFAGRDGIEVLSAGTNHDAEVPVTEEAIVWADMVFVMEPVHRGKLRTRFRRVLNGTPIVCLGIPDDFGFMEPELVRLLEARMARLLG